MKNKKEIPLQTEVPNDIQFADIFVLEDIQRLQDLFSDANGVSSIITHPDGTPITKPSNFCRLCSQIIRKTDKGLKNCFKSDALLGQHNPSGPIVQLCISGGLWDAGTSITIGGQHIANWLIGQVRIEELNEQRIIKYAVEIGADPKEFMNALAEVPVMSIEQFNKVSKMLFAFANELSEKAFNNLQLKKQIAGREKAVEELKVSEEKYRSLIMYTSDPIFSFNPDETYQFVNEAFANIFGKVPEDIIGKTPHSIFSHDEAEKRLTLVRQVFKTGIKGEMDLKVTTPTGEIQYYLTIADPIKDRQGQILFVNCVSKNITERKLAEEALRESEMKFRTIFNKSPIGIELYDANGMQIDANMASLNMFGIPEVSEIQNFNIYDGTSLDDEKKEKLRRGESVAYQSAFDFDKVTKKQQYKTNKSGIAYFDYIITPIMNFEQKAISGYLLQVQDITERKLVEKALQESEEKFRVLFETMPNGFYRSTAEGYFVDVNPAFIRMLGYESKEDLFKTFIPTDIYVQPIERDEYQKQNINFVNNLEQYRLKTKDGRIIYIEDNARYIKDEKGNVRFHEGICQDITERKMAEKALKESEALLSNFMKFSPVYTYIKDVTPTESRVIVASDNFVEMIGIPSSDMIGKRMEELFPAELAAKINHDDWEVITNGEVLQIEEYLNGRSYTTIKFPIEQNGKTMLAGYTIDISERKQAEIDLTKAKEQAEESDRLKSAFLANMSHEIRTPMNGILGFTDLLKNPDLTGEKQQKYIGVIEKSGERMLNIINDIINISKIESGQMAISFSETNINEQLEYIYTFFTPEVKQKGMQLSLRNSLPSKEATIKTDREKFDAIIINLVKNAIKYTDAGSIEFGYTLKKSSMIGQMVEPAELQFFVKDTGIGVPKNRQKAIFDRFVQADIADVRAFQGAGLGLSISKAYAEMLGGRIWLESEEGKGSTFYFSLPYNGQIEDKLSIENEGSPDKKNKDDNPEGMRLKILIADDDETSQMLIQLSVEAFSIETINVNNGTEAVEACRNNPEIDLVLMDVQMPVMNGYDATRQIRQFNKKVVIIAQTAYALSNEREKAITAGCTDYISKPLSKALLIALIKKYFNK